MNSRDLFAELSAALVEAKQHSEGKLTLKTHSPQQAEQVLAITPHEIILIREQFNMSRGVFARLLHTSARTLENWEQGRSVPNRQAVTLLKLVRHHPETLNYIAGL